MSGPPANEPRVFTVAEVQEEFDRLLRDRSDLGLRNLLGERVLEPRNPFQKVNRKPRRWVVATGGVFLFALLIVAYFHRR